MKVSAGVSLFVFERAAAHLGDTAVRELRIAARAMADSGPLRALLAAARRRPHAWAGERLWVFADEKTHSDWIE